MSFVKGERGIVPEGTLNSVLSMFGIEPIKWISAESPLLANICLVFVSIWRYVGFDIIMYIGAINSISPDLYEAADLDGANSCNQEDVSPGSPLDPIAVAGANHNYPYHGKAAEAGKTLSEVAKGLGWSASVWDFSGELPKLKPRPVGPAAPDADGQLPDFEENDFYNN